MAIYNVHITLESIYEGIEADNPDEAFNIAVNAAASDGNWGGDVQLVADDNIYDNDPGYDDDYDG